MPPQRRAAFLAACDKPMRAQFALISPHVPADLMRERLALSALRRWATRYAPMVAAEGPDGLIADVTGAPHLFVARTTCVPICTYDWIARVSPPPVLLQAHAVRPMRWRAMAAAWCPKTG